MSIQTFEIHGERFVILREKEFLELQSRCATAPLIEGEHRRFRDIVPLRISGVSASTTLIQDRR